MRDVKALHPRLQEKLDELIKLCKKNGITICIGECLRTVSEQDALYAQGRTKPGTIVTNARGSTYSSMHQWGVAADFYLNMDVDGDGKTSDDAFNNATKLFNKVGKLGQSIGLEWGGSWKSPVDLPHFQLPDWGSTASKLKSMYGTPEKFMKTWKLTLTAESAKKNEEPDKIASKTSGVVEFAKSSNSKFSGAYTTTANLNLRSGAGISKPVLLTVKKGDKVVCYGNYTIVSGSIWYLVQYGKYTGFVSQKYLTRC